MSEKAAKMILEIVKGNPYAVLGLATGMTPLGLYAHMIADHEKYGTSYAHFARSTSMSTRACLKRMNRVMPTSCARICLTDWTSTPRTRTSKTAWRQTRQRSVPATTHSLNSSRATSSCWGLGSNGHIAFNEPGTPFESRTHVVELAESTVRDNARLFEDISEVPRKAFTMGIRHIMQAKKILILASGANKADAVYKMVKGEVTEQVPASILQLHPDCTLIADEAAARKL